MISRALVGVVLFLMPRALPAQFFVAVGTETRQVTRAAWLGLSGEQSVAFEYGQPKWRPEYERSAEQLSAGPLLLGNGTPATLRTDVDLAFGTQKLARGRWYVTAWRNEKQEWSLALFAANRVDASGRGASYLLGNEPDLRVPARLTREDETVEQFEVALTETKGKQHDLSLAMAWGPYRLRVDLAASFDDRKPEGAPEFQLTAAGKGTQTASGLVYEQLQAGTGPRPRPNDRVRVHYAGWLTDGTLFDSSRVRGEPATLASEWVVKGFAEGLQLMQQGATFRLTIPPQLAYGERGAGNRVPPNATLVFTVTLLGIDKQ